RLCYVRELFVNCLESEKFNIIEISWIYFNLFALFHLNERQGVLVQKGMIPLMGAGSGQGWGGGERIWGLPHRGFCGWNHPEG
ncbi:MAG: hypothetical protein ABF632_13515, partial [Gluconobacter japonicus]|uniref:hypothetical protein n=1 Tax=Gluconobacter japonicus TaxID=376620 RepID=UPI0039ED327A